VNSGKTLFAQLMDFLPWSTFTRIVSRYGGDWRVRTLSCAELSVGAFPARPRRRSRAHAAGFTLATSRASSTFLTASCTTSTFSSCCSRKRAPSTSWIAGYVDFARLHGLHLAGAFFVTRAKSNINAHRVYSAPTDRATGSSCDQTIALDGSLHQPALPPSTCGGIRLRDAESGENPGVPHQSVRFAGRDRLRPLQEPMAGRAVLQVDQAASADQAVLRDIRKRGEKPRSGSPSRSTSSSPSSRSASSSKPSLYTLLQILSVTLFEKLPLDQALTHDADKGVTPQIN